MRVHLGNSLFLLCCLISSTVSAQGQFTDIDFRHNCSGPGTSRGGPTDVRINRIVEGVTRIFYAGDSPETSVRCNAYDDPQVLYYDVYPAPANSRNTTVIYIHGGGYNVGFANNPGRGQSCEGFRELGAHCISVEYRRGWVVGGDDAVAGHDLIPENAVRFRQAIELAKIDAIDAWNHIHANAESYGLPLENGYVLIGNSAGSSIATRIALTNANLDKKVAGVIVSFGTHEWDEPVVNTNFPVVIQHGLIDAIQPAFDNHVYFDEDMPTAKGMFNLRDELLAKGVKVRHYVNAQQGHGYGSYHTDGSPVSYYEEALRFFEDISKGLEPELFTEWQFSMNDCSIQPPVVAGTKLRSDTFRYDPRQAAFENRMTPDQVFTTYGRPDKDC